VRPLAPAAPPPTRAGRSAGRGEEDPAAAAGLVKGWGRKMSELGFTQEPILIYRSEIGG
jgi:hypothetical protein